MTATAVDAALCLVLISAGTVVLAAVPGDRASADRPDGRADAAVETLATTTATVNYSLPTREDTVSDGSPSDVERRRTTHGTLAELFGETAVARALIDDRWVAPSGAAPGGVRHRVADAAGTNRSGVQVLAVWRPYAGAHVVGRTAVGAAPPPGADVRAATVSAPSGVPPARDAAIDAAPRGFGTVADVVAARLVAGLLPADSSHRTLHGPAPDAAIVRSRYERLGALYGANVSGPVARGDVVSANRQLAGAVAPRVEAELRREYDSPAAAARSLRLDRVRIVVRTWS